jgi:hypothetical protein
LPDAVKPALTMACGLIADLASQADMGARPVVTLLP